MYGPGFLTINILGIILAWQGCNLWWTNTYPNTSNFLLVQWRFFNILWCFLLSPLLNCIISSCSKESSCGKRKRSPFLDKERTIFVPSRWYMFNTYTMCTLSTETLKGDPSLIINTSWRQFLRNIEKPLDTVPNDTTKRCPLGSLNLLIYHIYQSSYDTPWVSVSFTIPHRYIHTRLKV